MPAIDTASDPQVHVGDVGTVLVVVVTDQDGAVVNISGASALTIYLTKPRVGSAAPVVLTKTASLDTDGTDGAMKYTTVSGDLSVKGEWKISGYVAGAGGWSGSTREVSFSVFASRHG